MDIEISPGPRVGDRVGMEAEDIALEALIRTAVDDLHTEEIIERISLLTAKLKRATHDCFIYRTKMDKWTMALWQSKMRI